MNRDWTPGKKTERCKPAHQTESAGFVSNREERIEPAWVSSKVGKEMDVACRECCPLYVGTWARTGLGEWRRRGAITLSGKIGGWRGGNRMLGRRGGDVFFLSCFWLRHELRQLWYMHVPPLVCSCFFPGFSSAPESLEPVLWPRTWLCELMWEQQQQPTTKTNCTADSPICCEQGKKGRDNTK